MNDGVVGVVIMRKVGVVFTGVDEYLEGKIKILLSGDHGDQAFRKEALGPGFDWWCDGGEGVTADPEWMEEEGGGGDPQVTRS